MEERTVRSVVNQWAKDHIVGDATPMAFLTEDNREDLIVRLDQLRADLEAARKEIRELRMVCDSDEFDVFERLRKKDQADLEAARGEIAKAQDAYERIADDRDGWRRQYAQSRATEAELRARVEQIKKTALALLNHDCAYCVASWCYERDHQLPDALRTALDAQEPRT